MSAGSALLTFSIGPVHGFIAQARRVADLWAGSALLSHLTGRAVAALHAIDGAEMIFPVLERGEPVPAGLTNRFVCRVPRDRAPEIAASLQTAVENEWGTLVRQAVARLRAQEIEPAASLWSADARPGTRQTDHILEIAWSWVPEEAGYAAASDAGARRSAASRLFRPFSQIEETGEKCAICGERTALPDGRRQAVRNAWAAAEARTAGTADEPYFRLDQGRLCLVCATKRLYPRELGKTAYFAAFNQFEPSDDKPYLALVALDGDNMGDILGWPPSKIAGGDVEGFQRALSRALLGFAASLRVEGRAALNLETLGLARPDGHAEAQLVYAGGEDVLLVCDPRDALRLAWSIREAYRRALQPVARWLADPAGLDNLTISAGILFAHTKHPAGLLFRDVEDLLKRKAKREAGRDAVALRLAKRGGVPVETAFKWDQPAGPEADRPTWVESFDELIGALATGALSSRQTYLLRHEEEILFDVFQNVEERWTAWLRDRLSRREEAGGDPDRLSRLLAPFFMHRRTEALRLLRFVVREAWS